MENHLPNYKLKTGTDWPKDMQIHMSIWSTIKSKIHTVYSISCNIPQVSTITADRYFANAFLYQMIHS